MERGSPRGDLINTGEKEKIKKGNQSTQKANCFESQKMIVFLTPIRLRLVKMTAAIVQVKATFLVQWMISASREKFMIMVIRKY